MRKNNFLLANMNFGDSRKEFEIRRALRALSRQRIAFVLQPGNVWVIERAIEDNEQTDAALKTCFMRGWVEPLENALPKGRLTGDGGLPPGNIFDNVGPFYRLTDSGWSVINRSQQWLLISVVLALLTLIVSLR